MTSNKNVFFIDNGVAVVHTNDDDDDERVVACCLQ
jgi:hypothetical protein